ncbi:GntR family transcriptional regulator [Nonomuraea rubra]|uniref:GntR family transcriptional regulator n=1 Tax=Nonomuraea rubra TaxID=46180 RepID=UPI003606B1DA
MVADLSQDRPRLGRSSTAERVADILRDRISEGFFQPGQRLSEESISEALGVSRNTLREAFRLLGHERLLDHRLNRGCSSGCRRWRTCSTSTAYAACWRARPCGASRPRRR